MPRKPTRGRGRPQPTSSATVLGSQALAASRKRLAQAQADRAAQGKLNARERRASDRAIARAKTAELRAELQQLRALGFYTPRLHAGEPLELTKSRRGAIRKAWRQLEDLQKGAIFTPYPTRSKKVRREIASKVKAQGGKATTRGVFLPREEGELRKGDTRLVKDRDTGLYVAVQTYRYTDRQGRRRVITAHRYLDGPEALERQAAILKRKFDRLAETLARNEAIRFTIGGPNGNVSRASFRTWEQFERRVMAYRRDPRAQATFMASLTVYVARREGRNQGYRVPVAWADARGRRREAAPENLYEGGLFPTPKKRNGRRSRK